MNCHGHEYQVIGRTVTEEGRCRMCAGYARNGYTPTVDGKIVGPEVVACFDHTLPVWEKALGACGAYIREESSK